MHGVGIWHYVIDDAIMGLELIRIRSKWSSNEVLIYLVPLRTWQIGLLLPFTVNKNYLSILRLYPNCMSDYIQYSICTYTNHIVYIMFCHKCLKVHILPWAYQTFFYYLGGGVDKIRRTQMSNQQTMWRITILTTNDLRMIKSMSRHPLYMD